MIARHLIGSTRQHISPHLQQRLPLAFTPARQLSTFSQRFAARDSSFQAPPSSYFTSTRPSNSSFPTKTQPKASRSNPTWSPTPTRSLPYKSSRRSRFAMSSDPAQSKPAHSPPSSPSSSAPKKARTEPFSFPIISTPLALDDAPITSAPTPAVDGPKKVGKGKKGKPKRFLPEESIMMDVEVFMGKQRTLQLTQAAKDWDSPLERDQVVEVRVSKVGSGGKFSIPMRVRIVRDTISRLSDCNIVD